MKRLLLSSCLLCSASILVATSATVTVVSNYLFNGISQTQEIPTLQASLIWAAQTGLYTGVWDLNIALGEGSDLEAYEVIGHRNSLNDFINLDLAITQHTYPSEVFSSDYNEQAYTKINSDNPNLNLCHTRGCFGTGTSAGHSIIVTTENPPINDAFG